MLGFAFLKAQMGALMGDPVELEHGNPDNCDTQQSTTTGLAYWRCTSNLLSFAAFPDGVVHWAWVPPGLQEWTGDADPPASAPIISATEPNGNQGEPPTTCVSAAEVPSLTCSLDDSVAVLGTLLVSGETNTFHFSLPPSGAEVIANLVDLPADYDLYLADESGNILAQSIEEGTTPEHVDTNVGGGVYYVYVHSDSARPVDPQNPYRLELGFATAQAPPASSEPAPE